MSTVRAKRNTCEGPVSECQTLIATATSFSQTFAAKTDYRHLRLPLPVLSTINRGSEAVLWLGPLRASIHSSSDSSVFVGVLPSSLGCLFRVKPQLCSLVCACMCMRARVRVCTCAYIRVCHLTPAFLYLCGSSVHSLIVEVKSSRAVCWLHSLFFPVVSMHVCLSVDLCV